MNSLDRIKETQRRLDLTNREMAQELRVSEFWYSKVVNGHRPPSDDLILRLEEMLRRRNVVLTANPAGLKSGGRAGSLNEDPAPGSERYGLSGEHTHRAMPTRADCEAYLRSYLDLAEADGAPENIPAIYRELKKRFPLDEWEKEK